MAGLAAGSLDRRLRIERPIADESSDGAGSGTWRPVGIAWAEVQDALPSRGERLADGINVSSRPARVRMRHRTDITPDMRFVLSERLMRIVSGPPELGQPVDLWRRVSVDRIMQIIAGPAELGRREGVEFMVEDYNSAGNAA